MCRRRYLFLRLVSDFRAACEAFFARFFSLVRSACTCFAYWRCSFSRLRWSTAAIFFCSKMSLSFT